MLTVTQEPQPRGVCFKLSGDLRLEDIARLRETFFQAMTDGHIDELKLDLAGLRSIDASGISLFVATKNSIQKHKGQLVLAQLQPQVYDFFERTNLDGYFGLTPSDSLGQSATRPPRKRKPQHTAG